MRLLYVTDLHGCQWKYDRLFKIARKFQADVIINGGDMLPKGGSSSEQRDFIANYFGKKHFPKIDSAGIHYLSQLGNDDLRIFDQLFDETCKKFPRIINLAQRKYPVGELEFIGMNWVVDYPFRLKDRCRMDTKDYKFQHQFGKGLYSKPGGFHEIDDWESYARTLPTIEDEMNRLPLPQNFENAVYVIHHPPYGTGLGRTYRDDYGSQAVSDFLQKKQPKLSLHGHIHESPDVSGVWKANIGRTICVQPGQHEEFRQSDEFTYVTIDLASVEYNRIKEKR